MKHDKMVSLAQNKLNSIEVLIYKVAIDSCISHYEFVSVNVLKEYHDLHEKIKNSKISTGYVACHVFSECPETWLIFSRIREVIEGLLLECLNAFLKASLFQSCATGKFTISQGKIAKVQTLAVMVFNVSENIEDGWNVHKYINHCKKC